MPIASSASRTSPPRNSVSLTVAQRAALAKLDYAAEQTGTVALLCGPDGVGKTTVLHQLLAEGTSSERGMRLCEATDVATTLTAGRSAAAGDLLLVDDAHRCTAGELLELVNSVRRVDPATTIVLAGQGRLLSLCLGDTSLERLLRLRVALHPFTLEESRQLLMPRFAALAVELETDHVVRTIHEIAGGLPGRALELADMAAVVAAAVPGRRLRCGDVEAVHRRLSMHAA